jgi:DNA-binding XRE family transcriptional regulator
MTSAAGPARATGLVPEWTFADRMRKIRRDVLDLEQGAFAEKLGVKRQAYAAWEMGRTHPRDILALARRVELVSGVPASWVLGFGETGVDTRRYAPAASTVRSPLSLVPPLPEGYQASSPSNGSSPLGRGQTDAPRVPPSAESVNYADAA